jgi:hypothetical protein
MSPDVIVHAAGDKNLARCEVSPPDAYLANVQTTVNLVETFSDARIIYISSESRPTRQIQWPSGVDTTWAIQDRFNPRSQSIARAAVRRTEKPPGSLARLAAACDVSDVRRQDVGYGFLMLQCVESYNVHLEGSSTVTTSIQLTAEVEQRLDFLASKTGRTKTTCASSFRTGWTTLKTTTLRRQPWIGFGRAKSSFSP